MTEVIILNKFLCLIFLVIFVGCNENREPKDALDKYISLRMEGESNKEKYFDVVDGELKKLIESLTDDEFKEFLSSMHGVKKRNLNVLHSTCANDRCHFTYVVSLAYKKDDELQYHADVKKVALIEKFENSWKLTDIVSEPKTFIKGIDPITPEDFSKKFGMEADEVKVDRGGRAMLDKDGKFLKKDKN